MISTFLLFFFVFTPNGVLCHIRRCRIIFLITYLYATLVSSLMALFVFCSLSVHSFPFLAAWTVKLGLLCKLVIFCFYFAWLGAELASKPCRVCEKQYTGGKLLTASFFLSSIYTLFLNMFQR